MVTDHNPLVFLQTQANLSRRQVRWSEYLQAFRFRWQYRPGRINVADPLSRVQTATVAAVTRGKRRCAVPELPAANPSANPSSVLPSDPGTIVPQNPNLATEQETVTDFQLRVQLGYEQDTDWLDGLSPANQAKCCEKQGFWWCGGALVIPDSQNLRKQCLHKLHNCPYSGHLGIPRLRRPWKGCTGGKAPSRHCLSQMLLQFMYFLAILEVPSAWRCWFMVASLQSAHTLQSLQQSFRFLGLTHSAALLQDAHAGTADAYVVRHLMLPKPR